jgi:hypothetical protein
MIRTFQLTAMVILVLGLAGCDGAEEAALPPAEPTTVVVAGPGEGGPPDVDNDAPAGECEDTANILSRVDRDANSLFRAVALDNRVGNDDGDGILGVRFSIIGDNLAFTNLEEDAPYCIFGSNEPDCGGWPRDENGHYIWGAGGPIVQPGHYDVIVQVFATQPDTATGQDSCEWNFAMLVVSGQ